MQIPVERLDHLNKIKQQILLLEKEYRIAVLEIYLDYSLPKEATISPDGSVKLPELMHVLEQPDLPR